tara:strand:+ start:1396 stop:2454 length:1059 start_codon:yes stop_codon:yes gene_type:complete
MGRQSRRERKMTGANLTSTVLEFDDESEIAEEYLRRGWTDGLPITPPTPDRVRACLAAGGRSPSDIVGTEPTKGRVITAEKVAVNTVMAGCLPEYFPVVVTAVEAMCAPEFNLHAITASTMGAAVLTVVSGPIAKELEINSGVGVFGPGHRANSTIGRAIRLIIINATGSASGEIDKATLGHPGKFSWCMAEADEVSPWPPMHVDRGFDAGDSTVSIFAGLSGTQVANHHAQAPEEILVSFRDAMFAVGPTQKELIAVLCPEHIGNIRAAGWSKSQVQQFLFETSQRSDADWRAAGEVVPASPDGSSRMVPVASEPDNVTILVAGGAAGAFSSIIPLWGGGAGSQSVTKRMQ